ncbi:MalY/PatB family protein [Pediococcus claussenii]|uniref:cysteine-S-conjugate beta-lyase n=1 Tax=Pediococcus claussenii (strain ATCC BAA-344 / DSM 14800 / JCM 18046 / KCTC 3811 / LMG 21948 / P06) TaxID=701521 RepID=G8PAG2_PEDCP|nr:MalY/PatB family protein [Pediococcus claussenii]AEV95751.1 aminotransferase class I and II family protein [Pediococcus claussenii ATCC BAA-344]ANZ69260.1 aminotransferase [Pediococcus claussenii]ANZ71079.1 aminotransferase [Pediococcus claussenii]KRN20363.1 hypothetical protein IV79_GL000416 [Pediococcus claussenii]
MEQEEFISKYAVDRHNTSSLKWDALEERFGNADLTPMWVADMEFKEPKAATEALKKRVENNVYGYSVVPEGYFKTYQAWQKKRHNIRLESEWLLFDNGVVSSLYTLVNTFTQPNDAVLILTPVYYPFHDAIKDNGRRLIASQLVEEDGQFNMDFADIERKIVENDVKLFIQCSPHNPVGRIWTEKELATVLEICRKHHVLVVSDEIHQDIEIGKRKFISALSVEDEKFHNDLIVVTSPSKTFNMAGLLNSHVIIPNEKIREQFKIGKNRFNHTDESILGQIAAEAAYRDGEEWLEAVLEVIRTNYQYVKNQLAANVPEIKVADLQGTYLLWVDLRGLVAPEQVRQFVQDKVGIAVDYGEWFGEDKLGCIRLNLATEPQFIENAVQNIVKFAGQYRK